MLRERQKRIINLAGNLLTLAAIGLVGVKLYISSAQLLGYEFNAGKFSIVMIMSILYGLTSLLTALAWSFLLRDMHSGTISLRELCAIYSRTQINKYIPGNIFHLTGRHLLAVKSGIGHPELITAAAIEIIGLIMMAAVVAAGMGMIAGFPIALFTLSHLISIGLIVGFGGLGVFLFIRVIRNQSKSVENIYKRILRLIPWYFTFVVVAGTIMAGVAGIFAPETTWKNLPAIIGIFAAAWAAGFITPGSPAGIGVRDAVMLFALNEIIGNDEALATTLVFRFVTICGDVFLFFIGLCLGYKYITPHKPTTHTGQVRSS